MHDLHLADKILKQILDFAAQKNLKRITGAKIKVGDILEHNEFINPENLAFNLAMLSKSTPADSANFHIEKINRQGEYIIEEIEGE